MLRHIMEEHGQIHEHHVVKSVSTQLYYKVGDVATSSNKTLN